LHDISQKTDIMDKDKNNIKNKSNQCAPFLRTLFKTNIPQMVFCIIIEAINTIETTKIIPSIKSSQS
jgi:hypothetical protein